MPRPQRHLFQSPVKHAINRFIACFIQQHQKVAVIDSEHLRSTKTLEKFGVTGIDILNFKSLPGIPSHANMRIGPSTDALVNMIEEKHKYGCIYLDYCCTPKASSTFDPEIDLSVCQHLLDSSGILIVTFSKRGVEHASSVARDLCTENRYTIMDEVNYFHTSAMLTLICFPEHSSESFQKKATFLWQCIRSTMRIPNRPKQDQSSLIGKKYFTNGMKNTGMWAPCCAW